MQDWLFNSQGRDPNRIKKTLGALAACWMESPDLRLGQLIYIVSKGRDIFSIEDDVLMEEIIEYQRRNAKNSD